MQDQQKIVWCKGPIHQVWKTFKKEKQVWTYAVKSEVMGLPVKAIMVGVCDDHGDQACGWSAFTAAVIAKPFEEAKNHLKKKPALIIRQKSARKSLRSPCALF